MALDQIIMKNIISKFKALSRETLFALLGLSVFFASAPLIRMIFPASGTVDSGGELHVMLGGLMAYGAAFLLVAATFYLCIRTLWNYAFNNDDKTDPANEKSSFKEDWQKLSSAHRVFAFTGTFLVVLTLACYCLKP